MKRVLFLAYLFPPIANSGTQRPLKFVKFLADHGWEPIVMTADSVEGHATDSSLLEQVPHGVRVIRVPMLSDRIADGITKFLGGTSFGKKIGDGVRWRVRDRRPLPDLYAWWQPTATRAALRVFRETGFDAIYATGFPWTTLLVGAEVARATGRPLVADFRDPWAGETLFRNERPSHEVELAFERRVVSSAAAVITVSDGCVRLLANQHPSEDPDKFIAVHNGFDPADFDVEPQPRTAGKVRIVYTGGWKDGYNPGELYNAIDWMRRARPEIADRLEVVMAGFKPGEAQRRRLDRYVTELGRVPHHEAVSLMRSADVLYFPHTEEMGPWAVPGKLYEYLATGVPVLAHTSPDTDSARILQRVGGAVVVPREDPGNLYDQLVKLCASGRFEAPPTDREALRAFERSALTGKLADVLTDVSSRIAVAAPPQRLSYPAPAIPRVRTR